MVLNYFIIKMGLSSSHSFILYIIDEWVGPWAQKPRLKAKGCTSLFFWGGLFSFLDGPSEQLGSHPQWINGTNITHRLSGRPVQLAGDVHSGQAAVHDDGRHKHWEAELKERSNRKEAQQSIWLPYGQTRASVQNVTQSAAPNALVSGTPFFGRKLRKPEWHIWTTLSFQTVCYPSVCDVVAPPLPFEGQM